MRAGGSGTRPYGELRKRFHAFVGAGPRPARQDSEPHRVLIFANSGPSGPEGIAEATQILRAGNFLPVPRDNPRNGGSRGWGSWRMRRSRIRLAPPPSAFLVTFWASKKSLAARRRRNPPRKTAETARRGRRALQGVRNLPPHPAPSGPPSPRGKALKGAVKSPCLMKKRLTPTDPPASPPRTDASRCR